ncbi:MAG: RNA 2',3'-cyclic phosphodiesterase [Thaumarchaeota archaeon]|nr:MAG: RNA 2',3'-cyclic phosphodiesterase [Candidatus Wolframiiraptor sp.]RLG06530.1 MAG: RNA 2',3'-cyclic phosphodiesterase [Nitrososphaerota archaeon]
MSELTRTFIAVDFDNPQIVSRAQEVQRKLMESGVVMKPVEPKNLHVTLWFFGELDPSRLRLVLENAKQVKFKPFKVEVKGVGYFPGGSRVNVIWLGIDDPSNGLKNILDQLLEKLTRLGFRYDDRGFTPHLTIGRVKYVKNKQAVLRTLSELKEMYFGEQRVDRFEVKKSVLTQRGPIYSDLLVVNAEEADAP